MDKTGHNKGNRTIGVLLALLSAVLFGVSTPISKTLLDSVPPFTLAGLFYLGAALLLLPAVLKKAPPTDAPASRGPLGLPTDAKNLRYLGGAVLFGGLLGPLALLFGLRLAMASSVAMLLNLETVATALLGLLLFREHIGRWTALANVGVLCAGVMLSLEGGTPGLLGGLLVALAALAWGFDNHFTALIDGIRPVESTFWKGLVAGSVNLTIGICTTDQLNFDAPIWLGALLVGGLSYGLSITLYISSAQNLGATRAQMIFAAAPAFGVLGAVFGLGESLTYLQGAAAVVLTGSIALLFKDDHGHSHSHESASHTHSHSHDDAHHNHSHDGQPASLRHSHAHEHEQLEHDHEHWPDLHHRHVHAVDSEEA
jgi:drug/metabolite transporter (DMT)-like permease